MVYLPTIRLQSADSLGWHKEGMLQAEIKMYGGNRWGTISKIILTVSLGLMTLQ
jgi:hypothetical protein